MCLDTGRSFKGTSKKWIPAWKVLAIGHDLRAAAYYQRVPLRRRQRLVARKTILYSNGAVYEAGYHAWLERPKYGDGGNVFRCFIRKVTAIGKQYGKPAIVGRELFIPALRMDGTLKKQGNPNRKGRQLKCSSTSR